jgi:NUBPL iron-transfer P-loop NTPase
VRTLSRWLHAHDPTRMVAVDVWGYSIPRMYGLGATRPPVSAQKKIVPLEAHGVKVMSIGFFVEEDAAVVWRGPRPTSSWASGRNCWDAVIPPRYRGGVGSKLLKDIPTWYGKPGEGVAKEGKAGGPAGGAGAKLADSMELLWGGGAPKAGEKPNNSGRLEGV